MLILVQSVNIIIISFFAISVIEVGDASAITRLEGVIDPVTYEMSFLGRTHYSRSSTNIIETISSNASNNLEEAIKLFDRALSINPNDVDTLANKGITLFRLDKHQEAIKSFNQCLDINPNHVACLYNKGIALERLGNASEALEYKERAHMIDPSYTGELIGKSKTE